ncbi:MAG: c-type cytochrome [Betaproteobacteria bacterium]|nr:c-type cytochrome [Betaproteobacteria bacterium]MBK9685445.1 c-type cytochrome [Betaproteobacteria bacterium]MBL0297414.1 c-type cytochrome [Betaproteobacteria bacterium]
MSKQRIPRRHDIGRALGALALILNLAACGGGDDSDADVRIAETRSTIASARSASNGAATAAVTVPSTEGRLLASNCSQCHGTLGTSGFGEIRGSDSSELTEFATKTANGNIMAAHAQGYTPEQLLAIAAYLRQ